MKTPITLITEVDNGTVYFEVGEFESKHPGEKLPDHVGKALKALTRDWKHKSEIYPPENPELAVKYLHRLHKRIPGIFESDQGGRYRLSHLITVAKVM